MIGLPSSCTRIERPRRADVHTADGNIVSQENVHYGFQPRGAFSAASLLADQQNKHSGSNQQGKQSTDGKRQSPRPVYLRERTLFGPRLARQKSAMYGRRPQCKENLTFPRSVRVQPCIRPLSAAVVAAGPDVIR